MLVCISNVAQIGVNQLGFNEKKFICSITKKVKLRWEFIVWKIILMGIDRMENNSYGKHLLEITLIVINRIGFIEKKVICGIKKSQ